jgi:hypothetical protein
MSKKNSDFPSPADVATLVVGALVLALFMTVLFG